MDPQNWIINCLKMYDKVITETMKNWTVDLTAEGIASCYQIHFPVFSRDENPEMDLLGRCAFTFITICRSNDAS